MRYQFNIGESAPAVKVNLRKFYLLAAACSLFGALTTILLIFLPTPPADNFEAALHLSNNTMYIVKKWILFIHPQLNLVASIGIAFVLFKEHPARVIIGTIFLIVWAYTEMSQQAFLIDALNQYWRPGYIDADSQTTRDMFTTLITGADAISDSKYFLLIYGFGMGTLLYGTAFTNENGFGKLLGYSLVFIGVLSISGFCSYYLGFEFLSAPVMWSYEWIYPYLQPLVRVGISAWIYSQLVEESELESEN